MTIPTKMKMTMTMMKPNVKVVIQLEYKIIVGKFAQDKAEATQRLPKQLKVCLECRKTIAVSFKNQNIWNLQVFPG